ncbi:uncharacterized protein LOC125225643 isoform X2 [Leguminivora glycinivorella]|uniref:uncharacterized protein LOC125225643 isoform X2 n=1 Tax=Leguminivora glycinivorella TaxID=1035111 RepID=UPI00201052E2|nr:uncharacterized protein LOC125225643 isoform X2 [Leguminivora glycinivorella]
MLPRIGRYDHQAVNKRLLDSLFTASKLFHTAAIMCDDFDHHSLQRDLLGHGFNVRAATPTSSMFENIDPKNALETFSTWLRAHEDAQVMLASVIVVIGIWWFVRTVLSLIINLICPLLVVALAVITVPQLRRPLMGENYPLLAKLLRNILLKLAENIRT